jgi:hypothetical protein
MNKVIVALDMAGCPNRCKHCWIGVSQNGNLNKDDLYYVAKEFRKIASNSEIASWYREPDYLDNYEELWNIENNLSDNLSVNHFELMSYWRAVRDNKHVPWLKKMGVNSCQLTLWGGKEKTDYYAKTIEEIINFMDLEERCKKTGKEFSLFVHQGSCDGENGKLYDIRVTPDDLDKIPERLIQYTLKHFGIKKIITNYEFNRSIAQNISISNLISELIKKA